MNYAVIKDSIVLNTIVADSKEIAEEATGLLCVEYTDLNLAHIGLGFDGTIFEQPIIVEGNN